MEPFVPAERLVRKTKPILDAMEESVKKEEEYPIDISLLT